MGVGIRRDDAVAQARPVPKLRIEAVASVHGSRVAFRINKALTNWNSKNRNAHWSKKNRERKLWLSLLTNALVETIGFQPALRYLGPDSGLPGARGGLACYCPRDAKGRLKCVCPTTHRRKVTVRRLVPSKRNLVSDEFDNLRWTTKELRDAIKGAGLIRDDSSKWCEMSIEQGVSMDGEYWTEIAIEPVEGP